MLTLPEVRGKSLQCPFCHKYTHADNTRCPPTSSAYTVGTFVFRVQSKVEQIFAREHFPNRDTLKSTFPGKELCHHPLLLYSPASPGQAGTEKCQVL